jgi:hypothetical protein
MLPLLRNCWATILCGMSCVIWKAHLWKREKALLRFAGKVTKDLPAITLADIDQLRAAGWNDEAIFYTITVCALFNFYNRWITASGVHAVSDEGHRLHGKVLAQKGYDPKLREQHLENAIKVK